jgi:hypothetical protein
MCLFEFIQVGGDIYETFQRGASCKSSETYASGIQPGVREDILGGT